MFINVPEKPKTQRGQLDTLWDVVCNHLVHGFNELSEGQKASKTQGKFMMGFQALTLALIGLMMALLVRAL